MIRVLHHGAPTLGSIEHICQKVLSSCEQHEEKPSTRGMVRSGHQEGIWIKRLAK